MAGVAPHPEGADAELCAGPDPLDAGRGLQDQPVDVVAPPVGPPGEGAAIRVVGRVVVEGLAGHRVRVEVVVEVDRVQRIPVHRVEDRVLDEGADLGQSGVVVELPAVRHHPVRVLSGRVGGDEPGRIRVARDPVRVEPGVQLQSPPVRLGDGGAERVPARVPALRPGEVLRPGLVRRGPQGVGGGPYLEHHRVQAVRRRPVEVGDQLRALLCGAQPRLRGPVPVGHGGEPHAPHLGRRPPPRTARRGGRSRGRRQGGQRGQREGPARQTSHVHTPPTPRIRSVTDRLRAPECTNEGGPRRSIIDTWE
ncbi:hypothetical protein RKD46_006931 [Streptomyces pseudovenezuelae]